MTKPLSREKVWNYIEGRISVYSSKHFDHVIIDILKERFKQKYRFGAEVITVKGFYGNTFNSDVGDVVIFGSGLNLPDTKNGTRNFTSRLWDVLNKAMTPETGSVDLTLMDSAYSLGDARYGVISPSSLCGVGSTTSLVKVKNSYDIVAPRTEDQKWRSLAGIKLIVHSEDWSVSGETYLTGIAPSDRYGLAVSPPLAFAPLEDYIVDVAPYPASTDAEDNALAKAIYVFVDPTVVITGNIDNFNFDCDEDEAALLLPGCKIIIHNEDYTILSDELTVLAVDGTQVTTEEDIGFVPDVDYEVELIGFPDDGAPYRFF